MKRYWLIVYTLLVVLLLPGLTIAQTTATSQTVENGAMTLPIVWGGPSGCVYNWFNPTTGAGLLQTSGSGDIAPFKAINNISTPITLTITATPTPRPALAYIPSQAQNRVTVINTTDYTTVAQIKVGKKPYGVAISKDGTRVYVTNYDDNTVSVIDGVNNKWLTDIPVGQNPTGVDVSPDGKQIYVVSSTGKDLYVINTADQSLAHVITIHQELSGVAVTPDGKNVILAGIGFVYIYNIDTNTYKRLDDYGDSHQIAFSPDGSKAFITGYVNYYLVGSDGVTLTFVYTQRFAVVDLNDLTVQHIQAGSIYGFGGILNNNADKYYMTIPVDNTVSVVRTDNYTSAAIINVGQNPNGIAATSDGKMFVVNQDSNNISVIDASSNSVIYTIPFADKVPFAFGNFITGNTCTSSTPITYTLTINPSPPTIIAEGTPAPLTTPANIPSPATKIDVSGINLTEGIAVSPPAGFEISLDDVTYSSSLVIGNGGTPPPVPLYIRLKAGNAVGTYSGDILLTSAGAANVRVAVTGTVTTAIPYVIASAAAGNITACEGSASANPKLQQFTVSGTLLISNIVLTTPANFEISLNANSGFTNTITLTNSTGTIANTVIYVRSAAAAKGVIAGNVSITSAGATPLQVAVKGVVAAPPVADQMADQTVFGGQNNKAINFTGTGTSYSWTNDKPAIGLAASGDGNIAAFKAINTGTTDIVATITVTPHNDPLAYVSMWDQNALAVINTLTGKVVNTIPVAQKPYATVVSPDGTTVYVANQNSGLVSIVNTYSGTVSNLTVGANPSGLALSPDGSTLYVTNGNGNTVQIFDANSHAVYGSITVGISPQGVAVSPDGSFAYIANRNSNALSVISAALRTKLFDITVGTSPESVVVSPDGSLVYVTNYNSNSVSVISTATNQVIDAIQVGRNPRGITINQDGTVLYVTNYNGNSVSIIRTSDRSIIKTMSTGAGSNPEGISISPDGKLVYVANFGSHNVTVINTADNSSNLTIGLLGAPVSFGSFIVAGTGCVGNTMQFKITVKPSVQHIFATGALTRLTTVYGTPSGKISFNVSGDNMSEGILVSPPNGFEVSADGNTFDKTAFIGTSGTIPATPVYIRLAATTPVGNNYAGDIILTSANVPDQPIATVKSEVTKAPLTITADNLQRNYGVNNPVLTATFTGFVNGENQNVLTTLPTLSTTATSASPPGQYPITISGGTADNYTISPVNGTLTVSDINGLKPSIPNTFTPNGDGVNDTWLIKNLNTYPNCTIDVFTRAGQQVYHSVNYPTPWDGRYNGANLPAGVYYYVINLNNGENPLSGYVTIIR